MNIRNKVIIGITGLLVLTGCANVNKKDEDIIAPVTSESEKIVLSEDGANEDIIYIMQNSDGSLDKVMVPDSIKNKLIDNSGTASSFKITDIEGKEFAYAGTYENAVPVNVTYSYYLNGNKLTYEECEGKNGHLMLVISYDNATVDKINKTCVPFAMASVISLDDSFTNVEVEGGKLLENGSLTMVAGLAIPEMKECFGIDTADEVIVEADVKDFKLENIYTIATSLDLSDLDSNKIENKLNELYSSMNDLDDATGQLKDGTKKLSDGTVTLANGASELNKGLGQLSANSATLNAGSKQIFESLLATATSTIKGNGLDMPDLTIANYGDVLKATIDSLDKDKVYSQAYSQVKAVIEANYKEQIVSAVTDTVKANVELQVTQAVNAQYEAAVKEAVSAEVSANEKQIEMAVTQTVKTQVESEVRAAVLEAKGLNEETYAALDEETKALIDAAITNNVEAKMASDEIKAIIVSNTNEQKELLIEKTVAETLAEKQNEIAQVIMVKTAEQMASDDVKNIIAENVEAQIKSQTENYIANDPDIQAKFKAASEGIVQLQGALAQLDAYNSFYVGLKTYTDGVDAACAGSKKLSAGANELKDGAKELLDGVEKFDSEGIQKLIDTVDSELKPLQNRFNTIRKLSGTYRPFSDVSTEIDGSIKYVFCAR